MNQAQNYQALIEGTRNLLEMHAQLMAASSDCISCEYEEYNDVMGQTLECVTSFAFSDGSILEKVDGVWVA